MIIDPFISEYERYKSLAELAVSQVDEIQIHKIFGEDGNSIAVLMNHISGNLKSRFNNFLTEDGEKSWRNRDSEFKYNYEHIKVLLEKWNEGFSILFAQLKSLKDDDLSKTVKIRGNELTVADALVRSLSHLSYHVGQIVLIAKIFAGKEWKTLSIPKGKSNEYNSNLSKERNPNK